MGNQQQHGNPLPEIHATTRTDVGFRDAQAAINEGRATPHPLWILVGDEHERDGFALKPSPWEGSGEYQRVSFDDGRSVLVRVPGDGRYSLRAKVLA